MGADSAELKYAPPFSSADLAEAKKLFPENTDFGKLGPVITIDNHRLSEVLNLKTTIFFKNDQFYKLLFRAPR